ncbi:Tab2/Atab2 family RNA-binding protein [Oscillatoriales cyanobacterium LEGE 11467]|uniref:Tab2/Atab2 family RNA-binding protein n=1 Tax=Zarconia navalis LEGE 11467 TaxID=1828826 RepID=A0A928Z7F1_9CYAN|nr:Tab2/Atab2 family RNA-binding protein [Zarconia navalis]MBE9039339.1 Tab2/Atab2 family RNA-binding protein [Zarconia navalis LEGE 11467]
MKVWQVDFYRRPLRDETNQPLWEFVACDRAEGSIQIAWCPQSNANDRWLAQQLQRSSDRLPDRLEFFRPECESLIAAAGRRLGISVEATRRTPLLKQVLQQRAREYPQMPHYSGEDYQPISVYRPAPVPVPEQLIGERWQFASLNAGDIEGFGDRPIPVRSMPQSLLPFNLGLASTLPIPGVAIVGGRKSRQLVRWLQDIRPVSIHYISGEPDGIILEAGLVDRWVLATFADREVAAAAQTYQQRLGSSQGLHFLLVRPDDSGMTYSGFWLLQPA